ncbi:MAG: NTP transferase domain-containing protein [Deltaproteobacteria bacterium]|nr:NTP transferase domain-containing protein [Deltaproteobacteria bacterium]
MARVLAAVASRLDSKRLPRKAIVDVAGVPLARRVLDVASQMAGVNEVALCTTKRGVDDELCDHARRWGHRTTRGEEQDMLSRFLDAAAELNADYVVRVTGDNPFSDPDYASALIRDVVKRGADYGRTQPLPLGATVEVMSVPMMQRLHAAMADPNESEYLMLYAFAPDANRCLVHEPDAAGHRQPELSLTVDTSDDLSFASEVFRRLGGRRVGLTAILEVAKDLLPARRLDAQATVKVPSGSMSFAALQEMLHERAMRSERQAVAVS